MSDSLCVGVCMIDWDAGVCIGCGRSTAEIEGGASSAPEAEPAPATERAEAEDSCSGGA
jgi:predicted Fe-S protein YdhL (DUF1289 family)